MLDKPWHDRPGQTGGGQAFCIKNSTQHKEIKLRDRHKNKIEAMGIRMS